MTEVSREVPGVSTSRHGELTEQVLHHDLEDGYRVTYANLIELHTYICRFYCMLYLFIKVQKVRRTKILTN